MLRRLRKWLSAFRDRREVKRQADVILAQMTALETKLLELITEYRESSQVLVSQMERLRGDLHTEIAKTRDLDEMQRRLERENETLRDRERYVEQLLLPAMTQGHARVIAMLEAETAIQIRRSSLAKGNEE